MLPTSCLPHICALFQRLQRLFIKASILWRYNVANSPTPEHRLNDDEGDLAGPLDPLGLLKGGKSKPRKKYFKYKPNPKRQLVFVVLALIGIAIGYRLGFVFQKTPIPDVSQVETPQKQALPQKKETTPEQKPVPPTESKIDNRTIERQFFTEEENRPIEKMTQQPKPEIEQTPKKAMPRPFFQQETDLEKAQEPSPQIVLPNTPIIKDTVTAPTTDDHTNKSTNSAKNPNISSPQKRPVIAMVIDDMGIDKSRSKRIVQLPGLLTTSYIAYATKMDSQVATARKAGHEIMLHIPMEPMSPDVDPGPNVLLSGIPENELRQKIRWNLSQLKSIKGVNNHMGSRFTSDLQGMRTLMEELKKKNLWFFDSITSGTSKGRIAAKEFDIPFTARNIFIDHDENINVIKSQLAKVERLARKQGYAIAIGHPRENTIRALEPWIKTIESKGFKLVPLSTLVKPWPKSNIALPKGTVKTAQ